MPRRKRKKEEEYFCKACGHKIDTLADSILHDGLCTTCFIWRNFNGKNQDLS